MTEQIGALAVQAMLWEVAATPKPGLVDRLDNGAHTDMDFFTFMSSAAALRGCFDRMAQAGKAAAGQPPADLLPALQAIGREEETKMFALTGGINTHKGLIFMLGLLCGAAGSLAGTGPLRAADVCLQAGRICAGLCERAFAGLAAKPQNTLTKGEAAFLQYGCTGARGEAESGYATLRQTALPAYAAALADGCSRNDALVHTLLHIIAVMVDTNIISRHNTEAAQWARGQVRRVLDAGGMRTPQGRQAVAELNQAFIAKNISPGGCADLLAATCFVHALEHA